MALGPARSKSGTAAIANMNNGKKKSAKSAGARKREGLLEPLSQSLCVECAKHPTLKRFVQKSGAVGHECGMCHRKDLLASSPKKFGALSSLIRALVRFYYDEWLYNAHFGGDDPEDLFYRENEIIEHAPGPGFPRSAESSEGFLTELFNPPYPDYDKGIAVFAGHHEEFGRLPPLSALSTSTSPLYEKCAEALTKKNYLEIENEFGKAIAKLSNGIRMSIPKGSVWFRARIGIGERFLRHQGGWTSEILHRSYIGNEIGAPPPTKATPGRLNRAGVSFLYLSSDEKTAAAEVRPHPGHRVSIAAFRCLQNIRVADFSAIDITDFSSSDEKLSLFHLAHTIGREIGLPITPEDRDKYSITQLVADNVHRHGFEGIRFPSSVQSGDNLCVFRPAAFSCDPTSGRVLYIQGLKYHTKRLRHLAEATEDDVSIP